MKMTRLQGRVLASGIELVLGPVALEDGGVLLVEARAGRLIHLLPNGERRTVAQVSGRLTGAALGPNGYCYIGSSGGADWRTEKGKADCIHLGADHGGGCIQKVDLGTGVVEALYTHCQGIPLSEPRDIVFDDQDGFWFIDIKKKLNERHASSCLYYAHGDGSSIRRVADDLHATGGLGLSPDGRTLYATEAQTGRLWGYSIGAPGELSQKRRLFAGSGQLMHFPSNNPRHGSLAVEENGNVCIASPVEGGISVFSEQGRLLEFHMTPETCCTDICFGGPNSQTAYITLFSGRQVLAVSWPRPGLNLYKHSVTRHSYEKHPVPLIS
ncbi:SMP-30/gluconolactonase/LRE family protein [Halomonas sp. HMF6819]|uniref:SMP-30/gluconolactonase/LRE family protein n=1 Tax=Halomonas sp. HMF6819 TaxID=3373085 RepID=UPI003795C2BC